MSKTDDGEPDVAQLEARIDALEEQYSDETVSDSEGNRVSLGGLLNSGLSRRQALKTMALVVSGATLTGAMTQSVAAQNAITGIDQLGEESDRIGTIYAEDIDTDTFTQSTDAISADSISTENSYIEGRRAHAIVWTDGDTVYADGQDGQIDSGGEAVSVINSAINSLPDGGGLVEVGPGDYEINGNINPADGMVLRGAGTATTFIRNSASATFLSGDDSVTLSNLEFSHFAIDVNADDDFDRGISIDNVENASAHHLYCFNSQSGSAGSWTLTGIEFRDVDTVSVYNNLLEGTQIKVGGPSSVEENIKIVDNISIGARKQGISCVIGGDSGTLKNASISGNVLIDTSDNAIFSGVDNNSSDCTVENIIIEENIIRNPGSGCIRVHNQDQAQAGFSGILISNNIAQETGNRAGIRVDEGPATVSGNTIIGGSSAGLRANAGHVQISDNLFDGTVPVRMETDCSLDGNRFVGGDSPSALRLFGGNSFVLKNNTFDSFDTGGANEVIQTGSTDSPTIRAIGNRFTNRESVSMEGIIDETNATGSPTGTWLFNIFGDDAFTVTLATDSFESDNVGFSRTQDLSTVTPQTDGEVRADDGTNFETGERAYADEGSGVWRAFSDPTNTVAY